MKLCVPGRAVRALDSRHTYTGFLLIRVAVETALAFMWRVIGKWNPFLLA